MAEALTIASGAAGLVSLGITICHGLLEYYASYQSFEDDVAKMCRSIQALSELFALIQASIKNSTFSGTIVAEVEDSIGRCKDGIKELRTKLNEIKAVVPPNVGWKEKAKASFQRTLFPFREGTLVKLRSVSCELQDHLSLTLQLLQM